MKTKLLAPLTLLLLAVLSASVVVHAHAQSDAPLQVQQADAQNAQTRDLEITPRHAACTECCVQAASSIDTLASSSAGLVSQLQRSHVASTRGELAVDHLLALHERQRNRAALFDWNNHLALRPSSSGAAAQVAPVPDSTADGPSRWLRPNLAHC